ncbi:MAG: hypothetical protein GY719_38340 [bacterium]|nr:hypothetical protein [bacterium]
MARKTLPPRGPRLELCGDLSVAFVNTTSARENNRQQGVGDYGELLAWARAVGVLSALEAERLSVRASERPELAEEVWARAAKLRSALFRLFLAVMAGRELPRDDLEAITDAFHDAMTARRMVSGDEGVSWIWAGDENVLDRMFWPVLSAATELLVSLRGRPHVRQCAAEGCTLFFIDRGRRQQKRWCEMKTCGRRVKSLRFYYRKGRAVRMRQMDELHGPGRRRRRVSKRTRSK